MVRPSQSGWSLPRSQVPSPTHNGSQGADSQLTPPPLQNPSEPLYLWCDWLLTACLRSPRQDTCGPSCCQEGAEGDAAFAFAADNHNYDSNRDPQTGAVGPGPWVVAVLDQFDSALGANYGAGLNDIYPCPLTNNLDPTNPRTCDPSTCTSRITATGMFAGETYGCYRCDEVARVGCTCQPLRTARRH